MPPKVFGGAEMICLKCGANLPEEYKFCSQCGEPLPKKGRPEPQPEPETEEKHIDPRHKSGNVLDARVPHMSYSPKFKFRVVRLSRAGGSPKEFLVGDEGLRVGTEDCEVIIEDDPLVSSCHAIFYYGADGLRVKDLDSLNGIYYRISEKTRLIDGMMFLCGEVYIRSELEKGRQKTSFLGSIVTLPPLYLHLIYQGGAAEEIYPVYDSPFKIGRENCTINFPDDRYLSRHHADVILKDNEAWLVDNKSKNGTFVRLDGEKVLKNGDLLFIGNQLFRIEAV